MGARVPRALVVGGSDPLCGAGVFADALTLAELGVAPLAALTVLVDQDSNGVRGFIPVPIPALRQALAAALADGDPDVVKLGAAGTPDHAHALGQALLADATPRERWVAIDPVLAGGSDGGSLAAASTAAALLALAKTLAGATSAPRGGVRYRVLLTPNAHELAVLLGASPAESSARLVDQAIDLAQASGAWVLGKAGHVDPPGADVLAGPDGAYTVLPTLPWPTPAPDVHGTGCRLASAIAAHLARGEALSASIGAARQFLARSVADTTTRVGHGRTQFVPARAVARAGHLG
ncbi:MAG: bifunctional hydroxymethylpyrimidine kinase/phosphomethylpyrimidine kinase [Myxococcales bacterium]|nr:bifunctional hydroxymethylpyrimidine kinase/phosphomethylpyrimidine kinase [Myxococcales bacterium]